MTGSSSTLPITQRYAKSLSPSGKRPRGAPAFIDDVDNPYLQGLFAPTANETESTPLRLLEGELPRELFGAYFRNGPNPAMKPKGRYHWFDGDGMVHGVWFENGQARYASRYIETAGLQHEQERGEAVWNGVLGPFDMSLPGGPLKDTANTDLFAWREQLLASWYESGQVKALATDSLRTINAKPGLPKRMSAHSKPDPHTGELIWFSYGLKPPFMWAGTISPSGELRTTPVPLPGPRRPHDIGVSERFIVLHDFPVFHSEELLKKTGKRIPVFHDDVPTRFGLLPRDPNEGTEARWFEAEGCYMLHVIAAWDEPNELVMIGCRQPHMHLRPKREDGKIAAALSALEIHASVHEWRFDLKTGKTSERSLDDEYLEFPTMAERTIARRCRYAYLQHIPREIPATFEALVKVDLETGEKTRFDYGPGVYGSEAPFAPRPGGVDEDDGWVLSFVTRTEDWTSECWVFDAKSIERGPIARLGLPVRVPAGFHATFVPGAS